MKILHAIHDFLPDHRAGSEIYAYELVRQQIEAGHDAIVLCAEYDRGREHGSITRRSFDGIPIFEIVNNWAVDSFEECYQPAAINKALESVLDEVKPDILHLQSLLNLSFDLPTIARRRGIPSVMTLHDFSLVCPSGGQRVQIGEQHVCHEIEPDRCKKCFPQSHFYGQMVGHKVEKQQRDQPRDSWIVNKVRKHLPASAGGYKQPETPKIPVTADDICRRLDKLNEVYQTVDLFVPPSQALGDDLCRFGMPREKTVVSDYGFVPLTPRRREPSPDGKLRIGFVGTLIWHKGVHVLIDAAKQLPPDSYELLIFGKLDTVPEYGEEVQAQADGHPIRFLGPFSGDPAAIYAQFDVCVVCSLWPENSPLVIHEAIMAGVPVVGARQGGIPGLVTHDRDGLIYEAYSADDLAASLRRLIDDPNLLQQFREALPPIKSIEQDCREWEAVYRELLDERGPATETAP